MEYHVVTNTNLYLLIKSVQGHIDEGWVPQGGVSMSGDRGWHLQAMIREEDIDA